MHNVYIRVLFAILRQTWNLSKSMQIIGMLLVQLEGQVLS